MSWITVTIDRLVLTGLEAGDRTALVEEFQSELSRMLADPATQPRWVCSYRTPVLRLGRLSLQPTPSGGRRFGGEMARAIGKGLKP